MPPDTDNTLNAGTLDTFEEGSLAKAIEDAFETAWANSARLPPLTEHARDDRRILFVAVAQGVVRHLKDNMKAFVVHVDPEFGDGTVTRIDTHGTLY